MEVRFDLEESVFDELREHWKIEPDIDVWENTQYLAYGITSIRLVQTRKNPSERPTIKVGNVRRVVPGPIRPANRWFLSIEIDPRRLLGEPSDQRFVLPLAAMDQVVGQFDDHLKTLIPHISFPSLSDWPVQRIEYAITIPVSSLGKESATVDQYVELFQRGKILAHFQLKKTVSMGTIVDNRSINIQCCSLHRALVKYGSCSAEVLEQTVHLLRFSIVVKRRMLSLVSRRYGLLNQLALFIDPAVSFRLVGRALAPLISDADYYSVRKAAAQLAHREKCDKRVREGCRDVLKAIDTAGSLEEAIGTWRAGKKIEIRYGQQRIKIGLARWQIRRRIRQLLSYGINPVPVPPSWKKGRIINPLRVLWDKIESLPPEPERRRIISPKRNRVQADYRENQYEEEAF